MTGTRGRHADGLRLIAARLELPPLAQVARRPGINEAYRLTIQYHDGRCADQVATLTHSQHGEVLLSVVYRRLYQHPALEYVFDADRFRDLDVALRRLKFDQQDDQPDVQFFGVDFWLIERASGSYLHDVVLDPESASGVHGWLVDVFREYLPEALRTLKSQ